MSETKLTKTDAEWRAELTPEQYAVCRCPAPGRPSSGKWYQPHEGGTYVGPACHSRLFGSDAKYDSGSGWPSYYQPIEPGTVTEPADDSHRMSRIEVRRGHCA